MPLPRSLPHTSRMFDRPGSGHLTVASLIGAADRGLLAEEAGVELGFSEGRPDEEISRRAARLLILAGADESAIPAWIEVGRDRARRAATAPPQHTRRG